MNEVIDNLLNWIETNSYAPWVLVCLSIFFIFTFFWSLKEVSRWFLGIHQLKIEIKELQKTQAELNNKVDQVLAAYLSDSRLNHSFSERKLEFPLDH